MSEPTLRDALARWIDYRDSLPELDINADDALSDPAIRAALTESIAEALLDIDSMADTERLWRAMSSERLAISIVARMLGDAP